MGTSAHFHSWHGIRRGRRPGRPLGIGCRLERAGALAVKARILQPNMFSYARGKWGEGEEMREVGKRVKAGIGLAALRGWG